MMSRPADEPIRYKWMRLIEALPPEGGLIVACTNDIARHVLRGIRARKGIEVRRRWTATGIHQLSQIYKVEGLTGTVVLDWTFLRSAPPSVVAVVQRRLTHPLVRVMTPEPV